MTDNETKDLAELGAGVMEQGIEVTIRRGDLTKVFVAVVAANMITYSVITTIKATVSWNANRKLRKLKKAQDN